MRYYGTIDPRIQFLSQGSIGEWRCCHEVDNQHFVDHNEFYQDFLIAYGARYIMAGRIDENADHYSTFCFLRAVGQQPFGHDEQRATHRFSGHFQRALRLQKQHQDLHAKADLGARAIDALALSLLIVDAKGVILHLNAGAERLLNSRISGLSTKLSSLYATDPDCKHKLTSLITQATAYPALGGAMFLGGQENRQVFVTPLPAASPFTRDWQTPLALILVIEPGKNLSILQMLGTLYDLSPAELRVASALLTGKSPEAYAQQAGVTMNTVRKQLKSLFSKTNTHRQSELVAVLSPALSLPN